jgi:hypothetical protein
MSRLQVDDSGFGDRGNRYGYLMLARYKSDKISNNPAMLVDWAAGLLEAPVRGNVGN